ncbi:hypothetical protein [Nocardia sp. NPDC051832]|uniref:hypothetical protein n=1 Tax=Nocardia sp. NPDC051832 TaxID=3155673 RepID=UPI00342134F8
MTNVRICATPSTATATAAVSGQFAATTTRFLATLAALEDPETLLERVNEFADQAYELGSSLIESGDHPLDRVQLCAQIRAQIPENLHHLLPAPPADEWDGQ